MDYDLKGLEAKAKHVRREVLDLSQKTDLSHFGGGFSAVELLVSLYDVVLKDEDKFILSKGHGCPPWYVLLKEKGHNPHLLGHPDIDPANGIHCTTGSLGHGLPIGVGMALARRLTGRAGQIYVLMSDGECQEGTTWESMLIASKHKLNNLTAIIDYNKIQASDFIDKVLPIESLREKFEAFNWDVSEVDGHSYPSIIPALQRRGTKPYMVIAHTIKGKGISYMENSTEWHSKNPTSEQLKRAYEDLR